MMAGEPEWAKYLIMGRSGYNDGKMSDDAPQWAKDAFKKYLEDEEKGILY